MRGSRRASLAARCQLAEAQESGDAGPDEFRGYRLALDVQVDPVGGVVLKLVDVRRARPAVGGAVRYRCALSRLLRLVSVDDGSQRYEVLRGEPAVRGEGVTLPSA